MANSKKKTITLTIHATNKIKARFKKLFGRWKEWLIDEDESANPTQMEFVSAMLDLIASELGVDL